MMKKFKTMDGNEACASIAYMFTEVAGIYPITPASVMAELVDEWSNNGKKNIFNDAVKVVQMQSEAGAAGMIHGALQSGALATTFTSSQGLLLMIPNMYKIAGEMLPCVIHVAARSIATHALSILGDHQDIYATRMTGFAILSSSSVQQVMDLSSISHLSTIKANIPFLNFFDGFRTSHELQKIEVLEQDDLIKLVDMESVNNFRNKSLSPLNKVIRGTSQNEDIYFQATEVRNKFYNDLPDVVNNYMQKINNLTGKDYKPFNYYGDINATKIIIAMGSVCETIKETIDKLNEDGDKVGLIEVHLYRPFSKKYFFDVLPKTVSKIAVLDRTKEPGSAGEPLYLDIVSMFDQTNRPLIIGGRYGLSSKDTNPSHIKAVYDFLDQTNTYNGFTIGIIDDVTNLSLPINSFKIENNNTRSFLIYGFGSDGMISCAKDLIKTVGDNTDIYVQGYFQYDSKKSGGLTRSHLRLSKDLIRSTYFVSNPDIVVCSKESYLDKYDMLSNIKDNGTFLYVTSLNEETFIKELPDSIKYLLASKHIKTYIIDAYKLALENNLDNKISMIMEACIYKISNIMDYDKAFSLLQNHIIKNFSKKGPLIVESNENAIKGIDNYLKEITIDSNWITLSNNRVLNEIGNNKVLSMVDNLKGNDLTVSDFLDYKDGSFITGTSKFEKRGIAEMVPSWISEKCIECNQCSLVCPHAVIRPYLLNKEEYDKAPEVIKNASKDAIGSDYKFNIGISTLNCMGCGLCAKTCPAKALEMKKFDEINHDNGIKYLINEITPKEEPLNMNVKNSQFKKPLFEYSGACAGCGETPYLKLLTQLFGDHMVVANATGCSSIYGASMPSMPYSIPWANSLFEDNAEYGYGMLIATNTIRNRIKNIMLENINKEDNTTQELFNKWLNNVDNYKITKEVYDNLDYNKLSYLKDLKDYLPSRTNWMIGGDGWAYDIGFGGIDHVLASNDNVNILVLDTEVYSNTGGQSSKASERGSIAKFASSGKKTTAKDLARIAMTYPNVYVAQICLGANMPQTINALMEAEKFDGPSIIIAYAPCISHGIKGGMGNAVEQQKKVVECGYFPIFRYNAKENTFKLDFKNPNFDLYMDFLNSENRFAILKTVNKDNADSLLEANKQDAIKRFNYYKSLLKEEL
ncbi:MAG: pyruvate:ferredoxin (flavodoxin) oxidoreductase [Bacilli bacterium]|nr:pyruvate:ferredoxin (flavodoxin) oxidoreductase [Bacilli bacterium]